MSGLNVSVEYPTRLCVVKGEIGYFHMWEHFSKPLSEGLMTAGQLAGTFSKVYGIVEFKNGVRRVEPSDIAFRDEDYKLLCRIDEDEEGKKRIIKGEQPDSDLAKTDIRDILMNANAITCTIEDYEPLLSHESKAMYQIPYNHNVTVDYNKLAKALYDAGYRKEKCNA